MVSVNYTVANWCRHCEKAIPKVGDGYRQPYPACNRMTRRKARHR